MSMEQRLRIDERLGSIDEFMERSKRTRVKCALRKCLEEFLEADYGGRGITVGQCDPETLREFLAWKDFTGRTKVHVFSCPELGTHLAAECECPKRSAAGTVGGLISRLKLIFDEEGRGKKWDRAKGVGNPATAPLIGEYAKFVREEQAEAHTQPKQATPIFASKARRIISYLGREARRKGVKVGFRYVRERDLLFFKFLALGGDRAGDLSHLKGQEVRALRDGSGVMLDRSFGKTLRGGGESNTFVLAKCPGDEICPVEGLARYLRFGRSIGLNLATGFVFRVLNRKREISGNRINYSCLEMRFKIYLRELGCDEGETLHGFRAGCAVTMNIGRAGAPDGVMRHIGWNSERSARYYARAGALAEGLGIAARLSKLVADTSEVEDVYAQFGNPRILPCAMGDTVEPLSG